MAWFNDLPVLSILIWINIFGAIPVALLNKQKYSNHARVLALLIAVVALVFSVLLYIAFNDHLSGMQFIEKANWIKSLNINYYLGVDGISMPLIVLTAFTTLIVVLASWGKTQEKVGQYLATFLMMQGAVIGVFASLDAILFYFFWEGMLIPMYLAIGIWGMQRRSHAAIKFFIISFFGSVFMLVSFLYLKSFSGSFDILSFIPLKIGMTAQILLFIGFLLAFMVKVPMWPMHTWLIDATAEAPLGGSVIIGSLMVKVGAYGFLRFNLPITPDASHYFQWLLIVLSLIGIVYVALMALAQTDMRKLLAYSSVSHMGFMTLGAFAIFWIVQKTGDMQTAALSLSGSLMQIITHAFGAGAMFIAFSILYQRMKSYRIADYGGVVKTMPYLAAFFMLFAMANVGLPGTSGFVGEFFVILSLLKSSFWITFFAASTLVLSATYTLWMYKRIFFGPVVNEAVIHLKGISLNEKLIFTLLGLGVMWIGLYPHSLLNVMHNSIGNLLHQALRTKI